MKILVISDPNPFDRQIRSGVIYSIYKQLSKYNDVEWIKPRHSFKYTCLVKFVALVKRLLASFGKDITYHNPILSKLLCSSIQKQIQNIEYDAIFSFDCMNIAYLKTNKPIFYRTDSLYPLMLNYYFFNTPRIFIKWGMTVEREMLNNISIMFAPSMWLINGVKHFYPEIDDVKLLLVESGANIDQTVNYTYKHNYGKNAVLNMLFVGFDVKRKGIDVAYDTLTILNQKYGINAILTVIGGKPEPNILQDKKVRYVGKLNKNNPKEFAQFYKEFENASLFLFPTKAECHGIVNCEASAFGLPIFSYATGGVPSYVKSECNGYALPLSSTGYDFAQKIATALQSGKMEYYSYNSRQLYIKKFNWDTWGEKTNYAIKKIVSKTM